MAVQLIRDPQFFANQFCVQWFSADPPPMVDVNPGAYRCAAGGFAVTVSRATPSQVLLHRRCGSGLRVNLEEDTPLLLAQRTAADPGSLRLSFTVPVSAVGAFLFIRAVPMGTPFTPWIKVRSRAGDIEEFFGDAGLTGDFWTPGATQAGGNPPAPFVGVAGLKGDRIESIKLDGPSATPFQQVGIGLLYVVP